MHGLAVLSALIRATLREAEQSCLMDWTIDEAPESFDATMEIEYYQSWPGMSGNYMVTMNEQLVCLVDEASLECWHSERIDDYLHLHRVGGA